MKACDRVDTGAMIKTLRAMNFVEKPVIMIEILYAGDSGWRDAGRI